MKTSLRLRIGDWEVDSTRNDLRRGGETVRLEPRVVDVLLKLAERPGQVLSREDLLSAVWPGVIVGDDALTQAIIKLRRALGDDAHKPAYIETISKRGYRLIAAVEAVAQAGEAPGGASSAAPMSRRLAAILSADIAGYSRLMGEDDAGTLESLKAHQGAILPLVAQFGGRVIDLAGDGILAEFPSAVGATQCAIEIQRVMRDANAKVPKPRRLQFRVGVHLGDVIHDGERIYGDGINIAARVQALAQPGGVVVSQAVYEQVRNRLAEGFIDLGRVTLKNIREPVRVYQAEFSGKRPAWLERCRFVFRTNKAAPLIAIFLVFGVAAGIAIPIVGKSVRMPWPIGADPPGEGSPTRIAGPALLSIAVMPFVPASNDAEDGRVAAHITREVTSALQRAMRFAPVASHGRVTKYMGQAVDPRAAGRDLNVRYLLEGSLSRETGPMVLVARLVETSDGTQIWSDSLTVPASESGNAAPVAALTNRLRVALHAAEKKRVAQLPKENANAMELVLRADALLDEDPSLKGALAARKLYEQALRQDPVSTSALSGLYGTLRTELVEDRGGNRDRLVRELDDVSVRAVRADRQDPRVWLVRSDALMYQSKWEGALAASSEALRIDPHRIGALVNQAELLLQTGRTEEVFAVVERGIALDPRSADVSSLLFRRCRANLFLGRYEEAIADCERGIAVDYEFWWFGHLLLVASYGQKGDVTGGAAAKTKLLKHRPSISIAWLKAQHVLSHPVYVQQVESQLYAGLRKAGIPEE